jgi:hypothetical protein
MTQSAQLIVNPETLGRTASGGVTGVLYLRTDRRCFPGEDWNDFVVVVLSWWNLALLQCIRAEATSFEIRFMEGPFLVELQRTGEQTCRLALTRDGATLEVYEEIEMDTLALAQSAVRASDQILAVCQQRGWTSRDVEELVRTVNELRRLTRYSVH